MELVKDPAARLKNLARAIEKEFFAKENEKSWLELIGGVAVILGSLSALSFLALYLMFQLAGVRRGRRYELMSALTPGQFLMIWAAIMAVSLVAGFIAYKRHRDTGEMVDQWSEEKQKNPFEPFAVMVFQTIDALVAGNSGPSAEKQGLFAAWVLKLSTEEGGLSLVSSSQLSEGAKRLLKDAVRDLPQPLEQGNILKNMFKSGILERKLSQMTEKECAVPGEAGKRLLKRFGIVKADGK